MTDAAQRPFFSITLSTRNRPELFQVALASVADQTFPGKEIIVVVDGSNEDNLRAYRALSEQHPEVRFYFLEHRPNGHGQSYSMNVGAANARGEYLCFLDDDDQWTDERYLENVHANIEASAIPVDMHYANQRAVFADGRPQTKHVWLEDLIPQVKSQAHNHGDSYAVDADFLFFSDGFAHLNCSIFRRDFYERIGGMDESIRYENDRDVYIRAVDAADRILFSTGYISLHNIPDVAKRTNMSTMASAIDKKLYQMRVYDKGIALAQKKATVNHCRRGKIYELKHTTAILARQNRYRPALHYAREALFSGFTLRWLAFTVYLSVQAMFRPGYGDEGDGR